ncbi:MAG TPA: hypothetical protein VG168_16450 [Bryobacteraceae bacterium]|nr:hypothetical protein [Bryobacteraceae bacterium]
MAPTREHFLEAINTVLSPAPFKVLMGIQGLSWRLMEHGKVTTASGDFTFDDFVYVRDNFKDVQKKLDAQWRDQASDKVAGKHEWIPTNMIPYMVSNVKNKAGQWRAAMDLLRSPTQYIVYTPGANNPHYVMGHPLSEFLDLNGHVGALYHKNDPSPRIKNMGPWHDGLREILMTHLNLANGNENFIGYFKDLISYVQNTVWVGSSNIPIDIQKAIPCDYYMDSACTQLWGANLHEMVGKLNAGCQDWFTLLSRNAEILANHY